jgi:TFIIF-interacting CTD phosphatase-like protein
MLNSLQSIQQADYVVPVEIEYHWHNVYVIKRPGVDNFLKKMGEIYEVVVFTASLSKVRPLTSSDSCACLTEAFSMRTLYWTN